MKKSLLFLIFLNQMKQIRKLIKMVDMFGTPIKFNIDGRDKYQSVLGGLTTLVMIAFIILFFQSQIRNFFNRSYLRSEKSVKFTSEPLALNLDYQNFLFAIRVEQPVNFPYTTSPFFNIKMHQYNYTRKSNKDMIQQFIDGTRDKYSIEIPLEPCSLELFQDFDSQNDKIDDLYEKFNFDTFLCPKKNFELYLQGAFLNEFFSFIKIEIEECSGTHCAPEVEVQKYLEENNDLTLSLYTSNFVINPDHNGDYAQFYMSEDLHFNFEPSLTKKQVDVFFKSYNVETDMSLFINEDFRNETFIFREESTYKESTVYKINPDSKEPPLTIFLRSDYFRYNATRRYQKIDELLSYFGGIFQLFLLFFGLFVTFYNERYMKLSLANRLYQFIKYKDHDENFQNDEDQLKSIIQQKKVQDQDAQQEQDNVQVHDEQIELKEKNQEDLSLKDIANMDKLKKLGFSSRKEFIQAYFVKILTKKYHVRFNLKYFLYVITCKKKYSISYCRQIEKGILMIEKDMNVKNILKRGQQVDKLKKLLLNSNQLVLFNFYPKPIVDENVEDINMHKSGHMLQDTIQKDNGEKEESDYEAFLTLLQAYEEIMKNWSNDESTQMVNSKLINLLGPELRNVFKISLLIQALDKNDKNKKLFTKQRTFKQKFEEEIADEEKELEQIRRELYKNLKTEGHHQLDDEDIKGHFQEN